MLIPTPSFQVAFQLAFPGLQTLFVVLRLVVFVVPHELFVGSGSLVPAL